MAKQAVSKYRGKQKPTLYVTFRPKTRLYKIGCMIYKTVEDPDKADFNVTDYDSPRYSVNYILEGGGTYFDSNGTKHSLKPGSFFQRIPGKPHTTRITSFPYTECFLFFRDDPKPKLKFFNELVSLNIIDPEKPVLQTGLDPALISAFEELYRGLEKDYMFSWGEIVLRLQRVFTLVFDPRRRESGDSGDILLVQRAGELLSANLSERISMNAFARELNVSPSRFRTLFMKYIGIPPGEYRISKRIDRACILLQSMLVKQVAFELGYADSKVFSKQFRKFTGMSPREFRE